MRLLSLVATFMLFFTACSGPDDCECYNLLFKEDYTDQNELPVNKFNECASKYKNYTPEEVEALKKKCEGDS